MRLKTLHLWLILIWLILIGLGAGLCHAYVFDAMDVSGKARAMGGAWVAVGDDASAVFYNPACLAHPEAQGVTCSFARPNSQQFESLTYLAAGLRLGRSQGLSWGYRKFGVEYGCVNLLDESTLSVGHGFTLMKDIHSSLALGYCLNIYSLEFGPTADQALDLGKETTYGVDVGFLGTLRQRTRIGLLLKNVNEPSVGKGTREPLPQWITAGVAYSPYYGVVTEVDLRSVRGQDIEVHMGMQLGLTRFLDTRFGFQTGPNSLTGGFTAHPDEVPVEIDYAYSSHSVLPGTHQFALRFLYGK